MPRFIAGQTGRGVRTMSAISGLPIGDGHARVLRRDVLADGRAREALAPLVLSALARPARALPSLSISKRKAPAKGAASTSFTVT